ncbi:MAG: MFS transporter [Brevinematales bacterium]|nr:MFS transporter [Brevinematales bacterium]
MKKTENKNVLLTGFTSFFTDISSEMIYPLIQAFVSSIMKSQAALIGPVLGLIEGISESTASILKLFSGYISDRIKKRKILAIIGYSLSAVSRILFFIPYWFTVFSARVIDRIGKGIRTAPRDALISESVDKNNRGKAFGFQRGMDFAGAFLGTLISFLLIKFVFKDLDSFKEPEKFYPIFLIALIPAFIGVIFLFFTKDVKIDKEAKLPTFNLKNYSKPLRVFFIAQFIFTLGNSSNQFLLLRSGDLGHSLSTITVMYLLFNLTTTIFSTPLGALSDKIGRKGLLILGYFIYAVVYVGFGLVKTDSNWILWILWIVYGLYYAMTEGLEKAFVSDLAPENSKGTAIGFYHMIVGITLLPASLIAGFLYSLSPVSPFIVGGVLALINCIILIIGLK